MGAADRGLSRRAATDLLARFDELDRQRDDLDELRSQLKPLAVFMLGVTGGGVWALFEGLFLEMFMRDAGLAILLLVGVTLLLLTSGGFVAYVAIEGRRLRERRAKLEARLGEGYDRP